jgi:Zn-dependent protease with chaperone function
VHTLLGLSSLLLVVLGGYLALGALRRLGSWSGRRDLQLLTLAAPVLTLAVGIGGVAHFTGRVCFLGAPPWDYTLGLVLPLAMGAVALGAVGLGLSRLLLLQRVVARSGALAAPELQRRADELAERYGLGPARRPRIRLCAYDRPLAITCGLRRPTILFSAWMVRHLDRRELEAVLAHELGHVARRDWVVVWLAQVLRDAFCYLPTSRVAYQQLQREKELACDDLAVRTTGRPLDLASALAKVWQFALGVPSGPTDAIVRVSTGAGGGSGSASSLRGSEDISTSIEARVERLLGGLDPAPSAPRPRRTAIGIGVSALGGLLGLQAVNVTVMLAPMGCGPASLLGLLGRLV